MSNNRKKTLNPIMSLPQELIEEIMVKLPVRSLLRFKHVCKSWFSLISDSKFAKSHYDLAAEPTHRYIFKSSYGSEVQSIDIEAPLDDCCSPVVSSHAFPHPFSRPYDIIRIYGSCRGFLLVHGTRGLLVWNPSTGVYKPILYSHMAELLYNPVYGFGYDPSTDDYLVLCMGMYMIKYNYTDWKTHIEIFSLKTNSWNQIEGFKFSNSNHEFRTTAGLLLNGALHWLVFPHYSYDVVIIAFDLTERSLLEIPSPHGIAMEVQSRLASYGDFHLRVMGDCLCLCEPGRPNRAMAEIWMMKEYKVQSSWTKSFVLSTLDIPRNFFLPICFTKFEGVFGSNFRGGLVKLNSKGVLIEHGTCRFKFFTDNVLQSAMYRESLLSLPCDFEELSEDGQQ